MVPFLMNVFWLEFGWIAYRFRPLGVTKLLLMIMNCDE